MEEKYRIPVIVTLLICSVVLTYWFHAILGLGTVFSHFFYIPIMLAALWWERRSIVVAFFLSGLLLLSGYLFRADVLTLNDYGRALMFIIVACAVSYLSRQLNAERRELARERDRAQKYLDVAGVMLVAINTDQTVGLINRRGCELLGYREDELLGKNWFDLVVPEWRREAARRTFYRRISGDAVATEGEGAVLKKGGEERLIEWQNTVLTDEEGRNVGVLFSVQDITDRRAAEDELKTAWEEANLYLDIMGHDINNANTVALCYADMLEGTLSGKEKEMVRKMRAGVCRSIGIIRNVSTIRVLHSSEPVLKAIDLDSVIRSEIGNHPDSKIAYGGTGAIVAADELLSEVLANLIGNSIKFGSPDVDIGIKVLEEGDLVTVSVEDTGPGVPDAEKPLIFSRLVRGNRKASGKGLGLYIVRMLVERYGGRVWVEDRLPGSPEAGAVFRFTLRAARDAAARPVVAAGPSGKAGCALPRC